MPARSTTKNVSTLCVDVCQSSRPGELAYSLRLAQGCSSDSQGTLKPCQQTSTASGTQYLAPCHLLTGYWIDTPGATPESTACD